MKLRLLWNACNSVAFCFVLAEAWFYEPANAISHLSSRDKSDSNRLDISNSSNSVFTETKAKRQIEMARRKVLRATGTVPQPLHREMTEADKRESLELLNQTVSRLSQAFSIFSAFNCIFRRYGVEFLKRNRTLDLDLFGTGSGTANGTITSTTTARVKIERFTSTVPTPVRFTQRGSTSVTPTFTGKTSTVPSAIINVTTKVSSSKPTGGATSSKTVTNQNATLLSREKLVLENGKPRKNAANSSFMLFRSCFLMMSTVLLTIIVITIF